MNRINGDFQHANILIDDKQISGVVDWNGFGAGDCIFDIATLLFYSYDSVEARERLWNGCPTRFCKNLWHALFAPRALIQLFSNFGWSRARVKSRIWCSSLASDNRLTIS